MKIFHNENGDSVNSILKPRENKRDGENEIEIETEQKKKKWPQHNSAVPRTVCVTVNRNDFHYATKWFRALAID